MKSYVNGTGPHVLVVDDEPAIRRYLRTTLAAHGYAVSEAASGRDALAIAALQAPDVIVLDLGLSDMDGLQVMRRLREWSQIPIIVVSVRSAEVDKVAALDAGADDFLTKPFGTGELLARLRAALRHVTQPASLSRFNSGGLNVDLVRHIVAVDGHEIRLTLTEYGLLYVLITHAGKVITPRQLLGEVWGSAYEQNMHMLRVNMSNLRHKIETEPARPRYILTVPGVGYRLSEDQ